MFPEEVVQAGQDLNAKAILPVHWGKFALAYHAWTEPVERFTKRAQAAGMPFATPQIGQPVVLGQALPQTAWWRSVGTGMAQ
jgi:L-ascorbate metabolism protein UlaG (beta-lactamase superfamily)